MVEFLTDNTLGRIWYEMRKGDTKLRDQCRYMVRRPNEMFLKEGEQPPKEASESRDDLSQEELLKLPVHIPHRFKKDPRELKILDPACGSGHFLLYCFDLLLRIYLEAYADPDLGPALQKDYPTLEDLQRDVPRLILAHNLHGIDIDLRATQIAALALWLRCQRAYQDMGLKKDRPKITRSNFVCAEPMPGEEQMLKEFVAQLEPKLLGQLVQRVFDKMKMAGEAGSLLRIEEEIRTKVASAKAQWRKGSRHDQMLLFGAKPQRAVQTSFDFSGITDGQFFEQAETKVVEAFRSYAEQAQNGHQLQRRLFTDDAVRGFAFVDVCHKRFDVALMNPPFGNVIAQTRDYFRLSFPNACHDLCALTVERSTGLLTEGGMLGAITTRTALFLQTFAAWRASVLSRWRFSTVADLGYGVLDAMVETAMYVIEKRKAYGSDATSFVSVLTKIDKDAAILRQCEDPANGVDWRQQSVFDIIPGKPLTYWVHQKLLNRFSTLPTFNGACGDIRQGIATADDFRFLRLFWEVPTSSINTGAPDNDARFHHHMWAPMAKGGEYSPWWDDIHLLLNWYQDGDELKNFRDETGKIRSRPQNLDWFFRGGLTYPYRTTSAFGLRCLPRGCAFSVGGWGVFPKNDLTYHDVLAVYNSRVARYYMEVLLGQGDSSVAGSAARNHGAESVGGIPCPRTAIGATAHAQVDELISLWQTITADETTALYRGPEVLQTLSSSIHESVYAGWKSRCRHWRRIAELTGSLDEAICSHYALSQQEEAWIAKEEGVHPTRYEKRTIDGDRVRQLFAAGTEEIIRLTQAAIGSKRFVVKKAFFISREIDLLCHCFQVHPNEVIDALEGLQVLPLSWTVDCAKEFVSIAVGVTLGRWDIRQTSARSDSASQHHPLSHLPRVAPFRLAVDGVATNHVTLGEYPLRIEWDGIVVDDSDHSGDVVRRVREVIEIAWRDRADAIERELCAIVGIAELRDYLRKPGKGGFWDDHISRYSKSRRKAPIYWLLQSSKRNYAIWLYYHRLDKDLLFKALINYVEPKMRLETSRLEALSGQKATAGDGDKEAKRLAKEVERQEDFLSELRDFEDKLRRAANLYFEPDLNDGVVLNIAPLHELVPWSEAKKYWEELLAGKYEWSSIGKQLRQKGLVK